MNLGAYYLCGIPTAAMLGFWLQLRGRGLWIGIQTGAIVQVVLLSIITSCTNWEKQVQSTFLFKLSLAKMFTFKSLVASTNII